MRPDMFKVIVERPRRGGGVKTPKGSRKRLQQSGLEYAPRAEGMGHPWARSNHRKGLNEHLGPLRRYLMSQRGRPWEKVFGDLCENLRLDSTVQRHVREHVEDFVAIHVEIVDGELRHKGGLRWVGGVPQELYVHPTTGLLLANPKPGRRRWGPRAEKPRPKAIAISADHEIRCIDGLWFEVSLAAVPTEATGLRDAVLRSELPDLTDRQLTETYGRRVYAAAKRQLNSKEIRRYRREHKETFEEIEQMDPRPA